MTMKLNYNKERIEQVLDKIAEENHEYGYDLGLALRCGLLWNCRGI